MESSPWCGVRRSFEPCPESAAAIAAAAVRETQHFGRERFDNRRERLALPNSGDNLRSPLPVATNGVTIVEPTYDLGSSLNLVAMQQIERYQRVFHLRCWHTRTNGVLPESPQSRRANFENAVQFIGGIGSVVPQMGDRAG